MRSKEAILSQKDDTADIAKMSLEQQQQQRDAQLEKNGHSNKTFFELNDEEFRIESPLPRKQFFLYTIDEHETLVNKTFTVRKKLTGLTGTISSLSKSDTNLNLTS